MPEVQDIAKVLPKEFIEQLSLDQRKVLSSISNCRTAVLGTHIISCNSCEYEEFSYNSCRNRHCPKCQTFKKEEWIRKQEQYLMDIPYFHVVFTLPDGLNNLILQNQKVIYNLFFKCVSETISELTADEKYLGAKSGVTAVLHTWGQNLSFHPHIHCIIPGGGLKDNNFWVNSRKKFFLPVKVLSRKFRGKFMHYLKEANLDFYNSTEYLKDDENFAQFLSHLYQKEWVVYCKKPFGNAQQVINYLGRYTHRIAISNNRIKAIEDGVVTFTWRDYKDSNKVKEMKLSTEEFMRRFLMHILPPRLHKIRHYGLLAPKGKLVRILTCKKLTGTKILPFEPVNKEDILREILGTNFDVCPNCITGKLSGASPPSKTG